MVRTGMSPAYPTASTAATARGMVVPYDDLLGKTGGFHGDRRNARLNVAAIAGCRRVRHARSRGRGLRRVADGVFGMGNGPSAAAGPGFLVSRSEEVQRAAGASGRVPTATTGRRTESSAADRAAGQSHGAKDAGQATAPAAGL